MTAFLKDQHRWLSVERLWTTLGGMVDGVHGGFERIYSQQTLLNSFLTHAGMSR